MNFVLKIDRISERQGRIDSRSHWAIVSCPKFYNCFFAYSAAGIGDRSVSRYMPWAYDMEHLAQRNNKAS